MVSVIEQIDFDRNVNQLVMNSEFTHLLQWGSTPTTQTLQENC